MSTSEVNNNKGSGNPPSVIEPLVLEVGNQIDSEEPLYEEGENAAIRQYWYAMSAHLGAFIMAAVWSWSSTALPSLRESVASIGVLTLRDEAWIAAITFLGGVIGAPAMGQLSQKIGLRHQLLVATVPLLLSWVIIAAAQNVPMIIIGRFLSGFFVSGVGVSAMLVAEYCHKDRRGRLNFGFDLMFCAGVLFIYIAGTFSNWRVQAAASGFICVIFFVLLLFIEESPRHLILKRRIRDAKKAVAYLRDMEEERVTPYIEWLHREVNQPQPNLGSQEGCGISTLRQYWNLETMKPIIICVALQFFLQLCGVVPIVCYAVDVFKAAGSGKVHENVSTIVLGAINLGATLVAFFLVDKAGRRILMMFSEACLAITLGILGTFLYLKDELGYTSLENYSWFTLACLIVFIATYSFGVGPIPWVVIGEIVAPEAKGFSNGVINFAARVFGFFLMFYFKDMNIAFGQHGVYWIFSAICFIGLLFSYLFLPETKGVEMSQVQKLIRTRWLFFRG